MIIYIQDGDCGHLRVCHAVLRVKTIEYYVIRPFCPSNMANTGQTVQKLQFFSYIKAGGRMCTKVLRQLKFDLFAIGQMVWKLQLCRMFRTKVTKLLIYSAKMPIADSLVGLLVNSSVPYIWQNCWITDVIQGENRYSSSTGTIFSDVLDNGSCRGVDTVKTCALLS